MRPTEKIEESIRNLQDTTGPDTDRRILADVFRELDASVKTSTVSGAGERRYIMNRSRIIKAAAATVIIVAAAVVLHQLNPPIEATAFAQVVRPLMTAESGKFIMTMNVADSDLDWIDYGSEPVQTIEVVFSEESRTRWNVPTGEVLVADMHAGKVMILMPQKNQAVVMQVGPSDATARHIRFNKLLELRPLIQSALKRESDSVKPLGEREIEGVNCIGYHVAGSHRDHGDISIWANAQTLLPVRIEQSEESERILISEIEYNVELPESIFSVKPPVQYAVSVVEQDDGPPLLVEGTVTDAISGEAVQGARVVDDGYGPQPYKGAVTDAEGRYRYRTWPEEHGVKASAPGYKPQRKRITGLLHTETEDKAVIDFSLQRE